MDGRDQAPRGLPPGWEPCCAALAIGSLPHRDPDRALQVMLASVPEVACWPQLPAAADEENMYLQFAEGLPGLTAANAAGSHPRAAPAGRVRCDRRLPDFDAQLEKLFASYLAWSEGSGELPADLASVSPGHARGLHQLLSAPPGLLAGRTAVKGQITGPLSLGLAVTDERDRPLLYDEALREAACMLLRMKAAWQEQVLSAFGLPVIIFLDEPYMATYGSAFFSYDASLVCGMISFVAAGLHSTVGIHCCANTDWSLVLGGPAAIVSFDAYGYAETLALYAEEAALHLEGGGMLAFGIVPVLPEDLDVASLPALLERFRQAVRLLSRKGIDEDLIMRRALITPSCGLRSLSEPQAERALELCAAMSRALRGETGHTAKAAGTETGGCPRSGAAPTEG